ncbi:MAG: bla regulator protein blaR1 [Bryobacterales bacterium]|nr:bla regulator protein blaR1 [Bryobacterales bacterium]
MTVLILLVKVTLLFALALCCVRLMRRKTAALRHLVCAIGLSGALVFPAIVALAPKAIPVHLPPVFIASANAVAGSAPRTFPLATIVLTVWALGMLALLTRLAAGYYRISQLRETAERTTDNGPVYFADVSAPLICGLFDTAILLPHSSTSWPLQQRTAALGHELAHMERKDLLTSLLAHFVCAIYWFHPLAWALARQMRDEQEAACDDAVLSTGFEPATYAEALVATARQLTSTSLIGCHMLTHQTLKSRIARLLDMTLPRTTSTAALSRTAIASAAMFLVIGLVYAQPPQTSANERVYEMAEGITSPRVLQKVDPQYPDDARDAKIEGTVLLSVVIRPDGLAHDINVTTTPDASLGVKAVEAVGQWKFQPGTKDGEPVSVRAMIEVNFRLK